MNRRVVLIPGDGIGDEVTSAARRVVDASGVEIEWIVREAGGDFIPKYETPLPEQTLGAIRDVGVALKGPITTPVGSGFSSVNVRIRRELDLYANYRPARSLPGVESRFGDVDLILIRENTEGLYSGLEHEVVDGVVESLRIITRKGSERIIRFAFETARRYGRERLTAVHKANILKLSDGLFLGVARELAKEFDDIDYDESIVDAAAMRLVQDPRSFDVLVMENLFGDILSDLTAGLIGGLGMAPSGNIGLDCAVFEAVHGSAPDIAGQGIANPTGLLLASIMMLRHLGLEQAATRIENAVHETIRTGRARTRDLGGDATTEQFVDAVIGAMR